MVHYKDFGKTKETKILCQCAIYAWIESNTCIFVPNLWYSVIFLASVCCSDHGCRGIMVLDLPRDWAS